MIREFFYLQKSDRKVIITLLIVIVVALGVIFFSGSNDSSNALTPADTLKSEAHKPYRHRDTVYVRTKVVYRNVKDRSSYAQHHASASVARDSFIPRYPIKIHAGEHIVLNTADTTALKTVPGIGPYYARRIVNYRQRLGGYYRTEQLLEIEGFPESALSYFSIADDAMVRKLNVNRLSLDELRRHPYIGFYRAKQIVDFRRIHGRISSLSELSLSKDFTPEVIERLEHYVEY